MLDESWSNFSVLQNHLIQHPFDARIVARDVSQRLVVPHDLRFFNVESFENDVGCSGVAEVACNALNYFDLKMIWDESSLIV